MLDNEQRMATQTLPAQDEKIREIVSYDPATGDEIGRARLSSAEDVRRAVDAARRARPAWSSLSYRRRGKVILRARELMLAERDEIARLISRETGKP